MSPDVAASIRARLLNKAKQSGEDFELFLVRYGCERFLYRLGVSPFRDHCVLKGAGLLALWMNDPYRATRDVDLLASGPADGASIRRLVTEVCAVPCDDGLQFDLGSLAISPIRAEQDDEGQRAVVRAFLAKARIRLQIDVGFGDAVTPAPQDVEYPTLLAGVPAPHLRAYPKEATIAEKFEAMVTLGQRNSRMKDFHDVWALASQFAFHGPTLRQSVVACFERRGIPWTDEQPDVLTVAFFKGADLQARWRGYKQAGDFRVAPPEPFETVGERVREFLGPLRSSIVARETFEMDWPAGGPWR